MAGINVKVVSERLGHASVSFTLDTYAHVMPGQQAEAAAAAAALLGTVPSTAERAWIARCSRSGSVVRFLRVEFHRSAAKHAVDPGDVLHALDEALVVADLGDDDSPSRTLILGPDRAGNLLEVIVLHFDDARDGDPRHADAESVSDAASQALGDMT